MDRNNRPRRIFVEDADSDGNIVDKTRRYRSLSRGDSGYQSSPSPFSSSEGWPPSIIRAYPKNRNDSGAKHSKISREPFSALPVCSTISRDSTAGEGHRKSEHMAFLGSKQSQGLKLSAKAFQHIYKEPPRTELYKLSPRTAGKSYKCSLQACKHKEKIWPRADNFRAHLKRVHQQNIAEEDLERFVIRTAFWPGKSDEDNMSFDESLRINTDGEHWDPPRDAATASIKTASICYDEALVSHETSSLAEQFHLNMDLSKWSHPIDRS